MITFPSRSVMSRTGMLFLPAGTKDVRNNQRSAALRHILLTEIMQSYYFYLQLH